MNKITLPSSTKNVLTKLHIDKPILLGKGGEGYIFSYGKDTVIKIYNNASYEYLQSLAKLQKFISNKNLPFSTPEIQEINSIDSTYYTIEKRLTGVSMEQKFPTLTSQDKYTLLKSYYDAIKALNTIPLPNLPYGNIAKTDTTITDKTWQGFLTKMTDQRIAIAGKRLEQDVVHFDRRVQQFKKIVKKELYVDKKYLVHADYFINQVLVNDKNEISAVLDISAHAVAGDKRLDVASVAFFEEGKEYLPEHIIYLTQLAVQDYGESILKYNEIYKIYYCFYFSDIYLFNPSFYQTIIKNLNDEKLWNRIS